MTTVRIPLVEDLSNRDNTISTDSKMVNCYFEQDSDKEVYCVKRAGTQQVYALTAGTGLGQFGWNGHLYTIVGTTIYKDGVSYGTVDGTSQYQFASYADSSKLVLKNNAKMYTLDGTNPPVQVTHVAYPASTVPGVVYLDGTFYVMNSLGQIFGSAINDATTWSALNVIQMGIEPGVGVALAKQLNYVVALGTKSTEIFYDAGNATGSPLSPVGNAYVPIGCVNAGSVAQMDGTLFYMSYAQQRSRSIVMVSGLQPKRISTPFVERLLDADTLSSVFSYCIKFNGHTFYVLNLVNTNITLLYQLDAGVWSQLSTTNPKAPKSVTSLTYSNGVVTAVCTSHGYSDGDPVTIAGATPSGYNGLYNISFVDANTFTYSVSSALSTPATGTITAIGYTEGFFNYINYTFVNNTDYLQETSDGGVYTFNASRYLDDLGYPINSYARTNALDFGNNNRKFYNAVVVIGDKVNTNAYIRHSDDDFVTHSAYRQVNLLNNRPQIRRNGSSRRRSWELLHSENSPFRIKAFEIDVDAGIS